MGKGERRELLGEGGRQRDIYTCRRGFDITVIVPCPRSRFACSVLTTAIIGRGTIKDNLPNPMHFKHFISSYDT